ncbi:peptidase inhibitor family I36 protein [Streptomyces sp.]|uniref:peptidase inhibitor family I36 protein n=1 Tax=Streptomyces sp. TaxID=1931 RepID=UPI002D5B3145|nr:peptidase inhibitor family I36 protein [Streptomyces sp.]HZF87708.1 peptidase inhibitor family I36 protein [Streptomyces sp.]
MKRTVPIKRLVAVAAALATAGLLSAGANTAVADASPAQSRTSSSADSLTGPARAAAASWHAYSSTGFTGPDRWFDGNVGECKYVGDSWNDRVRSARTEVDHRRVELWDHSNCTGGSIVIDGSGYSSIGAWVSAYRIVNE